VARPDRPLAGDRSAGPLRGGERLRDERPSALDARSQDAAWPDAEIVLVTHGGKTAHRAMALICLGNRRIRRLRRASAPREFTA
jgi:hypothetical protein